MNETLWLDELIWWRPTLQCYRLSMLPSIMRTFSKAQRELMIQLHACELAKLEATTKHIPALCSFDGPRWRLEITTSINPPASH